MILIAFENGIFPLLKQHPLGMHGWRGDEMDSSEFLLERSDILLPSFQLKEKTKKEEPNHTVDKFNKLIVKK